MAREEIDGVSIWYVHGDGRRPALVALLVAEAELHRAMLKELAKGGF